MSLNTSTIETKITNPVTAFSTAKEAIKKSEENLRKNFPVIHFILTLISRIYKALICS